MPTRPWRNARLHGWKRLPKLERVLVEPIVRAALLEDIGRGGDLTTEAIVTPEHAATAEFVARAPGVVAGIDVALLAFALLDQSVETTVIVPDGDPVGAGDRVATVRGRARPILTGERTALNFLNRLSGIATATRALVEAVAGTRARVADTRKTTPGLRILEKYAVRCGGGVNHRFGLDDAVLIKDNHLALCPLHDAVAAVRARVGHTVKVEVEVDTLEQLAAALEEPIDAVLLDNMSPEQLTEAVRRVGRRVLTEASGGVTLESIAAIARSGVDLISVGRITHSAAALDIGLDVRAGDDASYLMER
ncbi:MAG: carboxylating nicotinate-nucleotide diphosphorylase [Candidatus Eremiobacteraeota bacterium]|nr:carboxylating nicotinate-nucleotide diphosphorylase [Candidatus Eremiobacteraeota bacterium]